MLRLPEPLVHVLDFRELPAFPIRFAHQEPPQ